jgi:prophage DNA circulation protein
VGRTDIEDALKRLDKLTQDEVRMATAQLLKLTHEVDDKVTRIDDGVKGVDDKVKVVDDKVNGVGDTVKLVLNGAWCEIFIYQSRYQRPYNQMEGKQK